MELRNGKKTSSKPTQANRFAILRSEEDDENDEAAAVEEVMLSRTSPSTPKLVKVDMKASEDDIGTPPSPESQSKQSFSASSKFSKVSIFLLISFLFFTFVTTYYLFITTRTITTSTQ